MTDEDKTPAQKRAELLSDEDRAWLQELAAAPPLTEEQQDIIRAAFRGNLL